MSHLTLWRGAGWLTLLAFATACAGIGPTALRHNRNHYNMAIQRTDAQELLLNLVRLRYRDTPYFLQVASVSANLKLRGKIGAEAEMLAGAPTLWLPKGSVSIEESPTMTYTPLQGEQFVKQLLEPIDLEVLLLLAYSGWSVERALRLLVQEINGVANAPTASGPTPSRAPRYERFLRAAYLLRTLSQKDAIELGVASESVLGEKLITGEKRDPPGVYMIMRSAAAGLPETKELIELLRLTPGRRYYRFAARLGPHEPNLLSVVPRSIQAAMFYASQGVVVPEEDEQAGRVTVTVDAQGNRFEWNNVLGDLIQILSSDSRPENSYATVRYRGHYFYIDDSDLDSKSSFALLNLVIALQAGEVPSTGPVLTLPVSR